MSDCQICKTIVKEPKFICCDFGGNPQTDIASGTRCFVSVDVVEDFYTIYYECPPCKNGATIWRNQDTGPTIGRGKISGSGGAVNTVTDGKLGVAYFSSSVT